MEAPKYIPELSRQNMGEQAIDRAHGEELVEFLNDQDLLDEIRDGNVTLAMIRPDIESSTTITGQDTEIANEIEKHITDVGLLAKFSIHFDKKAINEFYSGGPKEIQLEQPPLRRHEEESRWDEFVSIMTAGPTTILLLHTSNSDAIQQWRKQVGHWNIEVNRDPNTIRGKFGVDNYNNLVHGSDAPESVEREVDIIKNCIKRQVS